MKERPGFFDWGAEGEWDCDEIRRLNRTLLILVLKLAVEHGLYAIISKDCAVKFVSREEFCRMGGFPCPDSSSSRSRLRKDAA